MTYILVFLGPPPKYYFALLSLMQMITFINSCVNPIIYWCLSDQFSKGFRKLFCCKKRLNTWSRHTQQSSSSSSDPHHHHQTIPTKVWCETTWRHRECDGPTPSLDQDCRAMDASTWNTPQSIRNGNTRACLQTILISINYRHLLTWPDIVDTEAVSVTNKVWLGEPSLLERHPKMTPLCNVDRWRAHR